MTNSDRIDPYVLHAFGEAATFVGETEGSAPIIIPVVLRVGDPSWKPKWVPDFVETSRLGCIVAGRGSEESLRKLIEDPDVFSIEGSRIGEFDECVDSIPFVKADVVHQHPLNEKGDAALVGIIDEEIDVLHEAFFDANGNTRILAVWDQLGTALPSPKAGYGTLHTDADINAYIRAGVTQRGLRRQHGGGHGTHVTSIAAGRAVGNFGGGVAPEAKIVVVIAALGRRRHGDPLSLGYSNSHIDALEFIRDFATIRDVPVVVNVSQGMNAGAHDGTSALETAFDEFSKGGREPGFVVVKSAGNEHGQDGHARLRMASNSRDAMKWRSKEAARRNEDVIELWFKPLDDLRFTLKDPNGDVTPTVDRQAPILSGWRLPSGNTCSLSFVRYHCDNGDSRLVITVGRGTNPYIVSGIWTLDIESRLVGSDGRVDAWIERMRKRPIVFTSHQDEEMTLSIPATARTVVAVGAIKKRQPFELNGSSSYGPTRDGRPKPDLVAPGEQILGARSGTPNDVEPMSGTSMACPHVAGAVALLLSRLQKARGFRPSAAQVRSALTQFTQNRGVWVPGMGYGALDVEAFTHAFD